MKLLESIQVGKMTLKNRIMFPPLTTGYEERDGSIGQKSLSFYERLAKGGASYVVIGDVAPVRTASPTPKLYSEEQIPAFKKLADTLHQYDCKVALQIFHPEYDVPGVGKMIMEAGMARGAAQKAKEEEKEEAQKEFTGTYRLLAVTACVAGSAVAGALSMFFNCTLMAPHGGIFVIGVILNPLGYLFALAIGSVVGMFGLALLKKPLK